MIYLFSGVLVSQIFPKISRDREILNFYNSNRTSSYGDYYRVRVHLYDIETPTQGISSQFRPALLSATHLHRLLLYTTSGFELRPLFRKTAPHKAYVLHRNLIFVIINTFPTKREKCTEKGSSTVNMH